MKTALVARYELSTLIRRPGYLILAFGLPLTGLLASLVLGTRRPTFDPGAALQLETNELGREGFVDPAGLIGGIPEAVPAESLTEYANETAARQALERGEIVAYYLVPAGFVAAGELVYVHPTLNPLSSRGDQSWTIRRALLASLLDGNQRLADQLSDPMALEPVDLAAVPASAAGDCPHPGAECRDQPLLRYIPTFMLVFTFVALTNGASLLIRSVSREKQTRMAEVLTSSVTPLQLMGGKIVGLGVATLLGFAAWIGAAALATQRSGVLQTLPAGFSIPHGLLPWSALFFVLGFALYASLMAGIGALVPTLKETTQASWLVMGPMLVGYMVGIFAIDAPHGALMVALSLFPFTSPMVMVQRLSIGGVPTWQTAVAAVLLAAAVGLAMRLAARLFRAQNLLSGQSFSIGRLAAALRG